MPACSPSYVARKSRRVVLRQRRDEVVLQTETDSWFSKVHKISFAGLFQHRGSLEAKRMLFLNFLQPQISQFTAYLYNRRIYSKKYIENDETVIMSHE